MRRRQRSSRSWRRRSSAKGRNVRDYRCQVGRFRPHRSPTLAAAGSTRGSVLRDRAGQSRMRMPHRIQYKGSTRVQQEPWRNAANGKWGVASAHLQFRVKNEIETINDGVDHEHHDAIGEPDGLDQRKVSIAHRVDHEVAQARIRIDYLDQQGAAEQESKLDAGESNGRQGGVFERVAEQDAALR